MLDLDEKVRHTQSALQYRLTFTHSYTMAVPTMQGNNQQRTVYLLCYFSLFGVPVRACKCRARLHACFASRNAAQENTQPGRDGRQVAALRITKSGGGGAERPAAFFSRLFAAMQIDAYRTAHVTAATHVE